MDDLPLKGSASDIFLPRLFGQLHRNRFEGVVRLALGQTAKVIYYRAGEIASAASNAESDRLAHLFIGSGRLTREQLDLARARIDADGSLGRTLIGMGFLTPAELLHGARDQVRQILNSCFLLTSGHYECDPGPLPPEVTALGLPTRRLIFDALMQAHDRQWIVRQLGSMESVYTPAEDLVPGLEALGLDPALSRVARYMDGAQTLRDLSSRTALDDFTVSKLFLALEILGMSRLVGSPPHADAVPGRRIEITPEVAPPEPEPVLLDEPLASDPVSPLIAPASLADPEPEAQPAPRPDPQDAPQAQEAEASQPIVEGFTPTTVSIGEPDPQAPEEREIPFMTDSPAPGLVSASESGETGPESSGPPPAEAEDEASPADVTDGPARTRRQDPGWQTDPETGDRVALGPVELTFDGKISPDEERTSRWTRWVGMTAAAVLIIGAALIYVMRNGGETGDAGPIASTAPPSAAADPETGMPPESLISRETEMPASVSAVPDKDGGDPDLDAPTGEEAGETMQTMAAEQAPDTPAPQQRTPETGTMRGGAGMTTGSGRPATAPATAITTIPEPTPADPPRGSISPFQNPSRYASALKILDDGDPDRAARIFQDLVVAERPDRHTMQLMVACQADTLRSVRAWSGDRGSLFIVPFSFKGRDCFRVCWGLYPTSAAADGARSDLPAAYTELGLTPIVVPIVRFRPSTRSR